VNIKAVIIIVLILGLLGFIMFAPAPEQDTVGLTVGAPAPDFELKDLSGEKWMLSELTGSVVIVNFWATWCPPCKEEMPSLNRLYEKYKSRDDFKVLTVLYNDLPENAREYFNENGFDFTILKLDNNIIDDFGVTGVPETYIIDKKGNLRKVFKGPVKFDSQASYTFMDQLLAEG
jgi:peroxiredoxin